MQLHRVGKAEGLWDSPLALSSSTFYLLFHRLSHLISKASFLWLSPLLSPSLSINLLPATLALHVTAPLWSLYSHLSPTVSLCHPTTSMIFITSSLPLSPSLSLMPFPYHHLPAFSPDTLLPLLPTSTQVLCENTAGEVHGRAHR